MVRGTGNAFHYVSVNHLHFGLALEVVVVVVTEEKEWYK